MIITGNRHAFLVKYKVIDKLSMSVLVLLKSYKLILICTLEVLEAAASGLRLFIGSYDMLLIAKGYNS